LDLVLHEAVEKEDLMSVKAILEGGSDPNIPDIDGKTPLLIAVISGNPEMVRLLLSHNADPFYDGFHDIPVFLASAFFGQLELVRFFMKMGFDMVHYRSAWGDTALSYASKRGFPAIVRLLVSSGSNVNIKNCYGVSPLMIAVNQGNIACCSILLSAGANVNDTDNLGRSVLRHAVKARCKPDLIKLLLSRGADPGLRDRRGRSMFWEPFADEYLSLMLDKFSFFCMGEKCSLQEILKVFEMARSDGKDPSECIFLKKSPEASASGDRSL